MVYEVDVQRIERQLAHLERCIHVITQTEEDGLGEVQRFARERALHIAVECMIDVGSVMIDGFIMRDPGGYLDIVDIMEDEQVVSLELASQMKRLVQLRERLVRYYDTCEESELYLFAGSVAPYQQFIDQVRQYLQKELM